jgi:hypothetical protein
MHCFNRNPGRSLFEGFAVWEFGLHCVPLFGLRCLKKMPMSRALTIQRFNDSTQTPPGVCREADRDESCLLECVIPISIPFRTMLIRRPIFTQSGFQKPFEEPA